MTDLISGDGTVIVLAAIAITCAWPYDAREVARFLADQSAASVR